MSIDIKLYILIVSLCAFVFSYILIPKIINVIHFKNLMDDPSDRSSHINATPNLGGIAFFIVLFMSFYFTDDYDQNNLVMSIIPGLIILFIVGLKDDLVILSPITKILAQIISALFLVWHESFETIYLHGFMGIESLPFLISSLFTVILIVTIINAVNLIDGIDGLASTISIIIFSVFGVLFLFAQDYFLSLTCAVMIGSLIAFLRYNLSTNNKIFMGDTGSMILGFLISILVIRLFNLDKEIIQGLPFQEQNLPYVVIAILIIPLFDTFRVFFLRIIRNQNPFSADRTHIHHLIIDYYNVSHRRTSFLIGVFNFLVIILFSFLAITTTQWELLLIFTFVILTAVIFFFALNKPKILRTLRTHLQKQFYANGKRIY